MTHESQKYLLEIEEVFWPLFFTSPLVVRFIGGGTVFCLTDQKTKYQTIVVMPQGPYSSIPPTEQLLSHFPVDLVGAKHYKGAPDLPVDFSTVRKWRRMSSEEIRTRRRHVHILTPDLSTTSGQDVSRLVFMNFWRANDLQLELIRTKLGQEQIWFMHQALAESRVLLRLKPDEQLRFRGDTLELNFGAVSHLLPVSNGGQRA